MKTSQKHVFVALVAVALGLDVACTDVSIEDRSCPCTSGWICCDDVCEQFACSSKKSSSVDDDDDDTSSSSNNIPGADYTISTLTKEKASPQCITADATTVFWMNADGIVEAGSTVSKENVRSRINPPVTKVATCSLLRSGDGLYVSIAEGNAIYWLSVSSDGANPVVGERSFRFATINAPVNLAQDATYVYALDGATGEVRRLVKAEAPDESDAGAIPDGGTVASMGTLLGTGGTQAYSLILAGDLLYWFDSTSLRRMPKAGGSITTLATIQNTPTQRTHDLVATADALYWIATGSLMTVPIAGGVAHPLPFTPVSTSTSDAVLDDSTFIASLAVSDRGLILAHESTVGLLGFQGGTERRLFRYLSPPSAVSSSGLADPDGGMTSLLYDTSRFIWIAGDGTAIRFRPLLETDAKLTP